MVEAMGTKRFRQQYALLQAFSKAQPKLKRAIIKNADPGFIQALVDIVINVLRGNLKNIPKHLFEKLDKHKNSLRKLAKSVQRKGGIKKVRSRLNQRGGFLPILPLLSTLIPLASNLISNVIEQ